MGIDVSTIDRAEVAGEHRSAAGQAGARHLVTGSSDPVCQPAAQAPRLLPLTRDPDSPWICVHHRADDGARVRLGLLREGWRVHWPRIIDRRPRRDDVIRPFLPGYMFAAPADAGASWHTIRDAVPNVIGIVGVREGGGPLPVPRQLVDLLIERAGGSIDGYQEPVEERIVRAPRLVRGERLRVVDGPYASFSALFLENAPQRRVAVLIEMFGRLAKVEMPREAVERI